MRFVVFVSLLHIVAVVVVDLFLSVPWLAASLSVLLALSLDGPLRGASGRVHDPQEKHRREKESLCLWSRGVCACDTVAKYLKRQQRRGLRQVCPQQASAARNESVLSSCTASIDPNWV